MRAHGRWAAAVAGTVLSVCAGTVAAGAGQPERSPASTGWRVVKTWGCGPGAVTSVTSDGPRSAWATGFLTRCPSHLRDLLLAHWDGRSWRQVRPPAGFSGGGISAGVGHAVAALSASYAWIFLTRGFESFALLYQNGHWRTFRLADDTVFGSAVVFSRSDAWAFGESGSTGTGYAVRFNGRAWRHLPLPVIPQSTASPAPRNIWVVGNRSERRFPYKLAHWTGRWHTITFPDLDSTQFVAFVNSVVADGADGAWVAVTRAFFQGPFDGVLLHRTGKGWAAFKAPVGLIQIGPIAHDGASGLWMMTADYRSCTPTGCSRYEMIRYSTHGWSTPASIGPFQVITMRLIPRTSSLWAGGYTYKYTRMTQDPTHAAILKFGR